MVVFVEGGKSEDSEKYPSERGQKTDIKLNPHVTPGPAIEFGPQWWEVGTLTTAPSLLPYFFLAYHVLVRSLSVTYVYYNIISFLLFFHQLKMLESTKELSAEHTFGSRPSWWPLMRRGVAFWIARDTNVGLILLHFTCTAVKFLRMCERCNDLVSCFQAFRTKLCDTS